MSTVMSDNRKIERRGGERSDVVWTAEMRKRAGVGRIKNENVRGTSGTQ